ncbi:hypothetical protein GCM10009547_09390 [Sporichthya brevicatena]|uniref:Response regulatory domain-containing protein n=2 Tax=Sporichthya brevicatena TaxID=171442 RepID=A0ABP3RHC6_9ACTN
MHMRTQIETGADAAEAVAHLDPPGSLTTWCGLQVLIADDSAFQRKLVTAALERTGRFDLVVGACDGNEAIGLAELLQPDVVLLDLAMPGLGGLEALPLLLAVAPRTRVIVMSGSAVAELGADALAAGARGYVEKGAETELPAVIDAVLSAA